MLYVTIIVIAILIVGCIITCNYLNHLYDSNLYENNNSYTRLQDCRVIVEEMMDRLNNYEKAEGDDKYKFHVSNQEIYSVFENIRRISCYTSLDD